VTTDCTPPEPQKCSRLRLLFRSLSSSTIRHSATRPLGLDVLTFVSGALAARALLSASEALVFPEFYGRWQLHGLLVVLHCAACYGLAVASPWGRPAATAASTALPGVTLIWFAMQPWRHSQATATVLAIVVSAVFAIVVALYLWGGRAAREYYLALASTAGAASDPRPRRPVWVREFAMTAFAIVPLWLGMSMNPVWWRPTFGYLFFDRSDEPDVQYGCMGQPMGTAGENFTIYAHDLQEMLAEYAVVATVALVALWAFRRGMARRRVGNKYLVALALGTVLTLTNVGGFARILSQLQEARTDSGSTDQPSWSE
jgi:hypothetical protein